jgi:hypothetical protein
MYYEGDVINKITICTDMGWGPYGMGSLSSVVEEAKELFHYKLKVEQEYEEYISSAWVNLDNLQFIDEPVVGSRIKL